MHNVPRSQGAIQGFAALGKGQPLQPFRFTPKELGPNEVEVLVTHCGICHTDLHLVNDDFGISSYPLVPGHEIVGFVSQVGSNVHDLTIGQRVGVGCLTSACFACDSCVAGHDNLCTNRQITCVGREGGYASHLRVDSRFAFLLPDALASEAAAPLFCGGITVFAPMMRHLTANSYLGVVGIGGLGHLALQYGRALGCHVTAFSTSPEKVSEAKRFGADEFVDTTAPSALSARAGTCDFLLSTVTGDISWRDYLALLRPGGKLCIVGVPPGDLQIPVLPLVLWQKSVISSVIGSRTELRTMLEFTARHRIAPQTELFSMQDVNGAFHRLAENKIRYRAVLTNAH